MRIVNHLVQFFRDPRHSVPAACAVVVLGAWSVASGWLGGEAVDFNHDVRPLLNERCAACHGGVKRAGGLSLAFRSDALDTNKSGRPAIVPGDPGASELIQRITHSDPKERMPDGHPPLSAEEIGVLKRWIAQGAQWADHWAYVKPEPVTLPEVRNSDWPATGLDHFVLARLEAEHLSPAPSAECATLLRRASLDLIGLPPSPEEAEMFCAAPSREVYAGAIDRLLASPRFGEHWAGLWLDLARYADSKGYERDPHRDIWRYRDWLIDAFNDDMPFDVFTIEQHAGDLLPDATDEQILATAFHRNTMSNDEGGTDDEEFRVAAIIDRVNTTFEVWQGTTMSCAQCHGHPYDPFRHEDYYAAYAFFNNTEDADRGDEHPLLREYEGPQAERAEELLASIGAIAPSVGTPALKSLSERVERTLYPRPRLVPARYDTAQSVYGESEWINPQRSGSFVGFRDVDLSGIVSISFGHSGWEQGAEIDLRIDGLDGESIGRAPSDGTGGGVARIPVQETPGRHDLYLVFNPDAPHRWIQLRWIYLHEARNDLHPSQRSALESHERELARIPGVRATPVLRELPPAHARVTRRFERGNFLSPADTIAARTPGALPQMSEDSPRNRLGFAQWLVSQENPLTARVTVNRFWATIFGTGIVETVEDFGTQGAPPSHPDLLDWLAVRFMNDHRWSIKNLLREIVLSATYRQSSRSTPELLERDPQNRLLARGPRIRLSAEQVRDQALFVSGLLSEKMHGPSVMPPQPPDVWQAPYSSAQWYTSEGEDRYRRALYTYWRRTTPYPSMLAFDSPTREVCISRRITTNTPLQALVTLNDPVFVEAARALAGRMADGTDRPEDRVRRGYRLALATSPDEETRSDLMALYEDAKRHYEARPEAVEQGSFGDSDMAALNAVAAALLNLDRFLTKE